MKRYKDHIKDICEKEGLKKQLSVAQVSEVMSIVAFKLVTEPDFLVELVRVGSTHLRKKLRAKKSC